MGAQRLPPLFGGVDPRPWSSILVALLDSNVARILEHPKMTAEVSVAQFQGLLEEPEVGLIGLIEHSEDPETNPLMDGVIEEL